MMTRSFHETLERVKALTPAEQRRLLYMLSTWIEVSAETVDEEPIVSIPPPIADSSRYERRRLIQVRGKPVSETIIEERR